MAEVVTRMVRDQGWHIVYVCSQPSSFLAVWSTSSLRRDFSYCCHTALDFGNLHELDYDQPMKLADPVISLVNICGYPEAGATAYSAFVKGYEEGV